MPCRTIAVANQKGGTGRTATTLSPGMALAHRGKRVLLVDTDPQGERDGSAMGGVSDIPLAAIDPFPGHPFQVRDDEEMGRLAESIAENGVPVPLTMRAAGPERYELVSGHRRKRAAELAGMESVPCIARAMGDDEAIIAMVDSNLQRETILPSERAFAYSMRLEAMKRQGQRTDLTCAQVAHKSDGRRSRDILAEEPGVSKDKVQRLMRLTLLIPNRSPWSMPSA